MTSAYWSRVDSKETTKKPSQLAAEALDLLRQVNRSFPADLTAEQQALWEQTLTCRSEVRHLKLQLEESERMAEEAAKERAQERARNLFEQSTREREEFSFKDLA